MPDIYSLPCAQRANFATAARLLSCLVTESCVQGLYLPADDLHDPSVAGIVVVLNELTRPSGPDTAEELSSGGVLAVVPLRNAPIFKLDVKHAERGTPVGLLDPLDMYPCIFTLQNRRRTADTFLSRGTLAVTKHAAWIERTLARQHGVDTRSVCACALTDALSLWENYACNLDLDDLTRASVAEELASSVRWQTNAWEHPPRAPALEDPSIAWEQSIVEGHPTHPVRRLS